MVENKHFRWSTSNASRHCRLLHCGEQFLPHGLPHGVESFADYGFMRSILLHDARFRQSLDVVLHLMQHLDQIEDAEVLRGREYSFLVRRRIVLVRQQNHWLSSGIGAAAEHDLGSTSREVPFLGFQYNHVQASMTAKSTNRKLVLSPIAEAFPTAPLNHPLP